MQQPTPRLFTPGAGLPEAGLPGDRGARIAARSAFETLQLTFLDALEGTPRAEWLRAQVRGAEEPLDLWLLRAPMFMALAGGDAEHRMRRQALRRGLDTLFPDLEPASGFVPL